MGAPQYEQAGADIGGTGTTNTIPRWTGPSTLGDSVITQDTTTGINIRVNAASSVYALANRTAFEIHGTTSSLLGFAVGGVASGYLTASASSMLLTAGSSRPLQLGASNAIGMTFDTSNNVGIGTASPQEKTQIYGDLKVGVLASGAYISLGDEATTQKNVGVARFPGDTALSIGGYGGIRFYSSTTQITGQTERMRISNAGTAAQSQVAIGTSSFTTGRALTTVADLDVFGVRVGRGGGAQANTCVGNGALESNTTGGQNTAVGLNALYWNTAASLNTAHGYEALRGQSGASTGANNTAVGHSAMRLYTTGSSNTAIGRDAAAALTQGGNNVAIGHQAGDSITTGNSNIVIGSGADVAAATDSNKLVIGDATNYVATNGGATTYYATAGALAGYIIVRLNGTDVKLPVYAL